MKTDKYFKKREKMVKHCINLTLVGANFEQWDKYKTAFFNSFGSHSGRDEISQRRYTDLMNLFTALYMSNFEQNTIYVYEDSDGNRYTTQKSNIDNSYLYKLPSGETISTTEQLHDRKPHLTQVQWDSMERHYYSKITGLKM